MYSANTITQRLLRLDTCSASDALDKLSLPGAVFGVRSLSVPRRVAGEVMTVKLGPPLEGAPKRHLGAGAIMAAKPGQIIVVEHGRDDVSGWGGLLCRAAVKGSIPAIMVDGACRDIDEAIELDLPVYARAAVPVTARGRVSEHAFNTTIQFAGVSIEPDDWVLADASGIVFLKAERIEEILSTAEEIFAKEQIMAAAIDSGQAIGDVMGANYEDMLKNKER